MRICNLLLLLTPVHAIIKAISIYGCETELSNFVCSWVNPVDVYITKLKEMGFNTLRFPFSYQYVINGNWNTLDNGMNHAYYNNMSVILDYHRTWNTHQSFDPFENISREQFFNAWITIVSRYINYDNFVSINAYNEYQGQDIDFVRTYHQELFDRIESLFPNRFNYYVTGTSWAGNLSGMSLEHLPYHDRIFYSVHKYSFSGTADERDWEYSFGNVGLPIEKLIVGEWGWMEDKPEQVEWAKRFIAYLKKKGIRDTCYWTVSHSHDTGNLYYDNCYDIKWGNYLLLRTLWEHDRKYLRI
jgi:hypothetical protein